MSTGLDVHVLTLPGLPQDWIDQRRLSLDKAAEAAGFPVDIHEIPGERGHIGRSRRLGYSAGSHSYVTHVDHDDFVRPNAFSVLAEKINGEVCAITTGESVVLESGQIYDCPNSTHHLAVFKRELLIPLCFDIYQYHSDQFILSRFKPKHIPECVYVHRVYKSSASRMQRSGSAYQAARELKEITGHG